MSHYVLLITNHYVIIYHIAMIILTGNYNYDHPYAHNPLKGARATGNNYTNPLIFPINFPVNAWGVF